MSSSISRVTRSKANARKNYNRLSRWYDALAGSSEEKYRQLGMQALNPRPGELILEVGFGTGSTLVDLLRAVQPDGRVYGIDLSEGMIAQARKRLRQVEAAGQAALQLADAAALPFADGRFDGIFMSFTLDLIDTAEIPSVLAECRRALRSSGRLAIVSMLKTDPPGYAERMYEWFHRRMPVLVDCRPILAQPVLRQAGFTIHSAQQRTMWGLPVEILLAGQE